MEPRLNYVEHEPKMRLFNTHSHTSEWLGYEAREKTRRKANEGKRRRDNKGNQRKNLPRTTSAAGGGETNKTETSTNGNMTLPTVPQGGGSA